ncbi:MAG: hypothetical protein WCC95_15720 [Candidatus Sulfotelmatobacter sp.]|jgi:hypothetical protein
MFEQLEDVRERPEITRGTVISFLLMVLLLGIIVGAQLEAFTLRRKWSYGGIGQTFLLCAVLWKSFVRPALKSALTRNKE